MLNLLAILAACANDYGVARSELIAQAASGEIVLGEGERITLVVRMEADGEALAPGPSSYADLTVFAVQEDGSPRLYATTPTEVQDIGVAPTALLDMRVEEPFSGCAEDAEDAIVPTTAGSDGACVAELPVEFALEGGVVSLQLDAYLRLNFASEKAPGEISVVVAPKAE